ncbi:MAG: AAA family ATPase [Planctomycetaceae bacterium]|jgi:hypothetical protein|nr:AAA family ATPase [Planctomycetaceae bacterium]
MRVIIRNLGVLESAEYELGDLTVVCGKNNTGKTLAAYTLYGFLDYWRNQYDFQLGTALIKEINHKRELRIVQQQFQKLLSKNLELAYKKYVTEYLPDVLGSSSERLTDGQFRFDIRWMIKQSLLLKEKTIHWISSNCGWCAVQTDNEGKSVQIIQEEEPVPQEKLSDSVQSLVTLVSPEIIPCAAVTSADRIGAAMFSDEIYHLRNKLNKQQQYSFLQSIHYPLPVRKTLHTIHYSVPKLPPEKTELQILFKKLLDGNFEFCCRKLQFAPLRTENPPITLNETSSSVRSLFPFWLQLYCDTELRETPVNMFMIDEPEMNLHPENQRILARLFVRLVNLGYKIYITTHSDYIVKEMNTLIMLYCCNKNNRRIMKRYGYTEEELLNPEKIRVYMTQQVNAPKTKTGTKIENETKIKIETKIETETDREAEQISVDSGVPKYIFVQAKIDELGISLPVFDDTINEMNTIQDEILAGGER